MSFTPEEKKHWYTTWWGVTILVFLCFLFAAAIAMSLLIYNYLQAIKSGQNETLRQNFYQSIVQTEDPAITALRQVLETDDDPYLGLAGSDVKHVVVEFIDFKCPICKAQSLIMHQLAVKYGYKKGIKIIVRDFPMESVHAGASQFAALAACAAEQDGYWLVEDFLFSNQSELPEELSEEDISVLAENFGFDKVILLECMKERGPAEVKQDYLDLVKSVDSSSIQGTPVFFVDGYIWPEGGSADLSTWEKLFANLGW